MSKPDESPPMTESGLAELFGEIRATVVQESQIVQAVFPNPPFVMQVFLQRVFAQSVRRQTLRSMLISDYLQIQQYMEQLLNKGSSLSDLAYLRTLQLVHNQTSTLVEDMKAHELPSITPSKSSLEAGKFRRVLSGSLPGSGPSTAPIVSAMLENAMAELFVPYIEGQKYLDRESKSLGELYAGLLANFTRYHASIFIHLMVERAYLFQHR